MRECYRILRHEDVSKHLQRTQKKNLEQGRKRGKEQSFSLIFMYIYDVNL